MILPEAYFHDQYDLEAVFDRKVIYRNCVFYEPYSDENGFRRICKKRISLEP